MYIWGKYRTFEITSGIILKMNLPLYKGFTLEITNKWWPLYRIKIYSKMHRESTKVTIMSRWPLYKGDRYDRFGCIYIIPNVIQSGEWYRFSWTLVFIAEDYCVKDKILIFKKNPKLECSPKNAAHINSYHTKKYVFFSQLIASVRDPILKIHLISTKII